MSAIAVVVGPAATASFNRKVDMSEIMAVDVYDQAIWPSF